MSREDRLEMLVSHHRRTLWVWWTIILLGAWTMVAPATLGYLSDLVDPSGGRGVWFSDRTHTDLRAWLTIGSDLISGLLLIVFGWRSLTPNRPKSQWATCFVGIWLTAAPVLFWSPSAAAYLNDTVVGALVISLSVLIPGMPNMIMYMRMGGDTPPGWSYNPSSWPQRWIMIVLGVAGWFVSRYLAAFQLGYIDAAWDPFFGDSTREVLNSKMSHMWPISDAALGTFSYTFEALMGFMGSPARWRTMPWMVTFFGILVIPLGLTHIFLVISQPVVVGHWCTLCLLAAAIMLPMIPLEVDEVVAMGQHVKRSVDRGEPFWRTFWKGGSAEDAIRDERSPQLMELPERPAAVFRSSVWGMSTPWNLVVATVLGLWLMATPGIFAMTKPASAFHHLGGALIVTVAVVAMGEVVRAGRWLIVPLGLVAAIVPWFLDGGTSAGAVSGTLAGLGAALVALPRGRIEERFGAWDRFVK